MKVWTREDVAKLSPQEVADRLNEAESRVARLRETIQRIVDGNVNGVAWWWVAGCDREERAFKAGYHCQWVRDESRYIFDPAMKPGDPDGAYNAWLQTVARGQ
jgi:hypothetical protein